MRSHAKIIINNNSTSEAVEMEHCFPLRKIFGILWPWRYVKFWRIENLPNGNFGRNRDVGVKIATTASMGVLAW